MNCEDIREAVSARLDGEPPGVPGAAVDAHLRRCAGCRAWTDAATALHRRVRVAAAAHVPDLTGAVLAAAPTGGGHERVALARWGLVLVAAVQLVAATPAVLSGTGDGTGLHVAREAGAWDAALAVGFLAAAWRPARAWGMVPLVAVLVAAVALTAAVDMAGNRTAAGAEAVHLLDFAGLARLWFVGRSHPLAAGARRMRLA